MDLTCKEIVKRLDEYIIGQQEAKRAVAVALRNRYRRSKLPVEQKRRNNTKKHYFERTYWGWKKQK